MKHVSPTAIRLEFRFLSLQIKLPTIVYRFVYIFFNLFVDHFPILVSTVDLVYYEYLCSIFL